MRRYISIISIILTFLPIGFNRRQVKPEKSAANEVFSVMHEEIREQETNPNQISFNKKKYITGLPISLITYIGIFSTMGKKFCLMQKEQRDGKCPYCSRTNTVCQRIIQF